MQETLVDSWVGKVRWRRDRLPTPVFLGFPCGSAGKEYACNPGDLGSIPGLGRSPGDGKGYPLQYSGLENSMAFIVAKSLTRLSDFHSHATLPWRREWQATPVFLPGESHGWRSLTGYSHKDWDMTERLTHATLRITFKAPFTHFLHSVLVLGF